jgi:dihydrofolate reductase
MRKLRYNVAATLDGFIADLSGGYDWITSDDTIDFAALFAEFDTFVMGRKTFEVMLAQGDQNPTLDKRVVVASRTLHADEYPGIEIVSGDISARVRALKAEAGADIWLFGGGELARALFDAGLVDTVEVAVMPTLLTSGLPIVPAGAHISLALRGARSLPSGIQMLAYDVVKPAR